MQQSGFKVSAQCFHSKFSLCLIKSCCCFLIPESTAFCLQHCWKRRGCLLSVSKRRWDYFKNKAWTMSGMATERAGCLSKKPHLSNTWHLPTIPERSRSDNVKVHPDLFDLRSSAGHQPMALQRYRNMKMESRSAWAGASCGAACHRLIVYLSRVQHMELMK